METLEQAHANDQWNDETIVCVDVAQIAMQKLAPLANQIDQEAFYPVGVMGELGKAGAFATHLRRHGTRFGSAIRNMQAISRNCGSTGFITWCQDVCGLYMEESGNSTLLQRLADHADGSLLGGTGLSNPMKTVSGIESMALHARPVNGGYRVSGTLPWVSNIGAKQYFGAIAAVKNSDGSHSHEVFFLIDIAEGVELKKCPVFSAMEGTSTWAVTLTDYLVDSSNMIADPALPFVRSIRPAFVLLQVGFGLGVIEASIAACREVEGTLGHVNQYLHNSPDELELEFKDLCERTYQLANDPYEQDKDYLIDVLDARAQTSELALKASQSSLLHQGARGYLMQAAPQRLIREAHFVAIVTPAIKHLRWEIARLMQEELPA